MTDTPDQVTASALARLDAIADKPTAFLYGEGFVLPSSDLALIRQHIAALTEIVARQQDTIDWQDSERDTLTTRLGQLEAALETNLPRLKALLDPDCTYDGNNIVIRCVHHGDAMATMWFARNSLAGLEDLAHAATAIEGGQ